MDVSKFYFDGMAYGQGQDAVRDLPIFAIHSGQSTSGGWDSAEITDAGQFRMVMEIVSPQVPVFLAMPQLVQTAHFPKSRFYNKLSVSAYRPVSESQAMANGGYLQGFSTVMVLKDVKVLDVSPIVNWGNLPIPPRIQKNYLERKMGRNSYIAMAVRLFVHQGDIA